MNEEKKRALEARGWHLGSAEEFLGLSEQEVRYIEIKLALSKNLKKHRLKKKLTQVELANRLQSNQSRIAKMEAGDPSVTIDLLVKSLLSLGLTQKDIAAMIG